MSETHEEVAETRDEDKSPEMLRKEFIKRFGVYAAGTCAGLFLLMSPRTSKAAGSDTGP